LQPESNEPHDIARQLLLRQADMEARLDRVENSVLFRALRWVGEKTGYRGNTGTNQDYSTWVEQSGWMEPSARECARNIAAWRRPPRISYLVCSPQAAESVSALPVPPCEMLPFADAGAWQKAVSQAQGDYSVIVPAGVLLSPLAAYRWGELLQDASCDAASCDAVYSDWDHVAGSGQRHTPRFTPESSPELLLRTAYWGHCFLLRTSLLKELGPDLDPSDPAWTHALALRIAESTKAVARIPEILWHSTNVPVAGEPHADSPADTPAGDAAQASIVICSRTPRLLRKCLQALRRSDAAQAEVVVVAHDCGAGWTLEQIASAHGARAVRYSGQFHFGVMNALGVQHSSRPAIVFLNDDVEPIASGWLSALLRPLRKKEVGIAGGLLLYPDDTIQHAGLSVGGRPSPSHVARRQTSSPWWPWLRLTREVAAVTGACLAIRRTVWDELGGFDRRFQINYNDVDLCLRARRSGYSVILESAALLYHREGQTRARVVTPAERALFSSLWTPALAPADPFFNPNLALADERIALAHPCLET
jgi:GT2 family glycosyltransferase